MKSFSHSAIQPLPTGRQAFRAVSKIIRTTMSDAHGESDYALSEL